MEAANLNVISNSQLVWNILQPHLPNGIVDGARKLVFSAIEGVIGGGRVGITPDNVFTPIKIMAGVVFPPLLLNAVHAMLQHTLNTPKALLNLRWFRPRTNTVETLATGKQRTAQRGLATLHNNFKKGLGSNIVNICAAPIWEQFTVEQIRVWAGGDLSTFNPAFSAKAGRALDAGKIANLKLAIQDAARRPTFESYLTLRGELEQELKKLGVDTRTNSESSHADADAATTRMHRMLTRTTIVGIVSALTMASLSALSAVKSRAINVYATKELFAQGVFGSTVEKAAEDCRDTVTKSFVKNGGVVASLLGTGYRAFAAAIPFYCGFQFASSFVSGKPAQQPWIQRLAVAPGYLAFGAYYDLVPEALPTFLGTAAQSMGLFSTMTPQEAGTWALASPLLLVTGFRTLKGLWQGWQVSRPPDGGSHLGRRIAAMTILAGQGLVQTIMENGSIFLQAKMWYHFKTEMTNGWQFAGQWAKSDLKCSLMDGLPVTVAKDPSPDVSGTPPTQLE